MSDHSSIPLLLEPGQLDTLLDKPQIRIVDLSKTDNYVKYHIPGARLLEYDHITQDRKPVYGLLPEEKQLGVILGRLGISPDTHVVAYDDEGGGKAARLLFTLDSCGHRHFSLLNGGIFSWANEGFALNREIPEYDTGEYPVHYQGETVADKDYILRHLDDSNTVLLDTRSIEEYIGVKRYADRGGHIPGAVNLDWIQTMDQNNNLRFKADDVLLSMLASLGVTPDREIITYCQTHHRSSHTYILLKHLGFAHIQGYPGAWSDWGNDPGTPVEN